MSEIATILAIGDVHLGTACSGVPDDISSLGIDSEELTPASALKRSVDFAIERGVDAVLFAGDVVESTNARFEAMLPLEEGVRQLLDEGIEVIAVAGNHDVEALPRLAALIDGFTLLGAGGRWESNLVMRKGDPVAEIIGWSFGERSVRQSPIAQLPSELRKIGTRTIPRIGLLHADLGASGGNYAPIKQVELDDTGYDAWLLGHIHKPSIENLTIPANARPSGYLGSLVGLDPSETGPHGPWLLKILDNGTLDMEQVPLAPLRWEQVSISVDDLENIEDIPDRLLDEARKFVHRLGKEGGTFRALGLRARLTGTSSLHGEIHRHIATDQWQGLKRRIDETAVFFDRIVNAVDLHLDIAAIAKGEDPAALMARRLLSLQQDNDQSRKLLEQARRELSKVVNDGVWSPVLDHRSATNPLSDDALREILLQSGKTVLGAMLTQNAEDDSSWS